MEAEDEIEVLEAEEIKKIFAAGWRAKQQTAETRKSRGWKPVSKPGDAKKKSVDTRKQATSCSSCGMVGHWRGDRECPNVKSGKDQPHVKPSRPMQTTHFTFVADVTPTVKKEEKFHEVFMVSGDEKPVPPPGQCPRCSWPVQATMKFCGECGHELLQDRMMSRSKRVKDDGWSFVDADDEPKVTFSFEVSKEGVKQSARSEASGKPSSSSGGVRLQAKELVAALPSMSKEDKKMLHDALQEEEQKEAYMEMVRKQKLMADTMREYDYMTVATKLPPYVPLEPVSYGGGRMSGVASSAAASDDGSGTSAAASAQQRIVPPNDPSLPKAVRDKNMKVFRKALYERAVRNGRLIPSGAAPVATETQTACVHPFDDLRWTANGDGHFARCKRCDLKHVIYWSSHHGVLTSNVVHEPPADLPDQVRVWIREDKACTHFKTVSAGGPHPSQICRRVTKDVYGNVLEDVSYEGTMVELQAKLIGPPRDLITEFWYMPMEVFNGGGEELPHIRIPGLAIADSGCKNSVGGRLWHELFQKTLDAMGVPWMSVRERETYRFGAGEPVVSEMAFLYPVSVHDEWDILRMSLVDGDAASCPGLVGPSELSRWKAVFRFGEREMELFGKSRPMRLTWTRHPGIALMDYGKEKVKEVSKFWNSEEGLRKRQILTDAPHSLSFVAGDEKMDDSESEVGEGSGGEFNEEEREEKVQKWLQHLHYDLGVTLIPKVEEMSEPEESSEAEESAGCESSSHEAGIEILTDDSASEDEREKEAEKRGSEVFIELGGKKKEMNKGLRKKLGHCVREVKESFQEEGKVPEKPLKKIPRLKSVYSGPRKWSVLEVFTWTCAISIMAGARGWVAHEPVTLPRWNLLCPEDYKSALEYIDRVEPDLLVLAWPCGPWSQLQGLGHKTPYQRQKLEEKRMENRTLLRFVRDAALRQRRRGGALLGENPYASLAWKEPLVEEAFDGMSSCACDMCRFGLRLPKQGPF